MKVDSQKSPAQWAMKNINDAVRVLQSDPNSGISELQAEKLLAEHGYNQLQEAKKRTFASMLLSQFKEVLVLILIGAAVISGLLGEWADVAVIMIIVIVNAFLGAGQENRAEHSLEALKKLSSPTAKVIREGRRREIPARELVPGDLVLLDAGDYISADVYLVESANLKIDESTLTGESVPVEKKSQLLKAEPEGIGDMHNLAFTGTVVTYGRGKGLVFAVGMNTALGEIAGFLQQEDNEPTPLQKRMAEVGKVLGITAGILVLIVFITGILRGIDILEMFLIAVSLAVAAIPEGLPAIVTVVLALGVQRMASRRAIIRKLPAVETLGAATIIATDKTGTLTQNKMTVTKIVLNRGTVNVTGEGYGLQGEFLNENGAKIDSEGDFDLGLVLLSGVLANDAVLSPEQDGIIGDPTEGALVVAAAKGNLRQEKLKVMLPREAEIPFDSNRKMMTTLHRVTESLPSLSLLSLKESEYVSFTKGAPDFVLERSAYYICEGKIVPLDDEVRERIAQNNTKMAGKALRVLAAAAKIWTEKPHELAAGNAENDMIFLGLLGMMDPPRAEVYKAVQAAKKAGVITIMVTGDYKDTAIAIAKEIDIWDPGTEVLSGSQIEAFTDEELIRRVDRTRIYARVAPEHKLRIVKALKSKGEVVAVTGDGVNDSPALKGADIGAAMGITGTDVAKGAADMVLADDNFATIVTAIREGRVIYSNIRKAIHYLLSCNIGEIAAIFAAIILGLKSPLTAIQILWVNLVTDGLPALALGVEPAEPGVMDQKPRSKGEGVFGGGLWQQMAWQGILIGTITLGVYAWGQAGYGHQAGGTMAFAALAFSQLFHSFNTRSRLNSLFSIGLFSNLSHLAASFASAFLLILVLSVPFLRSYFSLVTLTGEQWGVVLISAVSVIPVIEAVKYVQRKISLQE